MKKNDIRLWLKTNKLKIQSKFGLENWTIKLKVKKFKKEKFGKTQADVDHALFEYKIATITIYWNNIASVKELKTTINHELYHILLSPWTMFLDSLIQAKQIKNVDDLFREYEKRCEELIVLALEKKDRQ